MRVVPFIAFLVYNLAITFVAVVVAYIVPSPLNFVFVLLLLSFNASSPVFFLQAYVMLLMLRMVSSKYIFRFWLHTLCLWSSFLSLEIDFF